MWKKYRLLFFFSWLSFNLVSYGQQQKQYTIATADHSSEIKKVNFSLDLNTGNCRIGPLEGDKLFNVLSSSHSSYSSNYSREVIGDVCHVKLDLEDPETDSFGKAISMGLFSDNNSKADTNLKVYMSQSVPCNLSLGYGMGTAKIDLSGLSVETIKVYTGTADVYIGYETDVINRVEMDTFYVNVDFGTVKVKNLSNAKADHVIADVGFGSLYLDLSSPPKRTSHIKGKVGAGNLLVKLPTDSTPVRVVVNESWLCSLRIPKSFKKVADNTYVNAFYKGSPTNALIFNVDVSMGSVSFE